MTRPSPGADEDWEGLGRYRRTRRDARTVVAVAWAALVLGALLGSDSLVGLAERQEVGWRRDALVGAAETVDAVADALFLDVPGDVIGDVTGRGESETFDLDLIAGGGRPEDAGGTDPDEPLTDTPTPTATATPTTDTDSEGDGGTDSEGDGPDEGTDEGAVDGDPTPDPGTGPTEGPTTGPSATPDPTPTGQPAPSDLPEISGERPLLLYVGGDSMTREVGQGVARATPVDLVEPILDPQVSSGLSRPDYLDWPQRLAGVIVDDEPDAFVVMFGANDWQNFEVDGTVHERGSPSWLEIYRQRVQTTMDLLEQPGTATFWVGQPPMRDSGLSEGMALVNEIYRSEAAERPWVTFVDTWEPFSAPGGGYSPDVDGSRVRQDDGVHFSISGADRVGALVWQAVASTFGIPAG